MKISVIIPSYNPDKYLYECINSLYNQDLPATLWEIIIILNGNISLYKNKVETEIRKKPDNFNISLICTEISGVSNARNLGLDNAKGEYICFIDDDDIVSPSYLKELLSAANENNIVISNIYTFINNIHEKRNNFFVCNKLRNLNNYKNNTSLFRNRSFLAFPVAKIIHRNIIGNRRFNPKFKNGEDALFITSISDKIERIEFTSPNAIYYVRERIGSASRKKIPLKLLLKDSILLIITYIYVYIQHPFSYNVLLFLSRIPGVLKNSFILSKNK